jgi:hypothetical protein
MSKRIYTQDVSIPDDAHIAPRRLIQVHAHPALGDITHVHDGGDKPHTHKPVITYLGGEVVFLDGEQ